MISLSRNTIGLGNLFGLDSVQGYLEMANWYKDDHVRFVCKISDKDNHTSMYFELLQLKKEGYINVEFEPYINDEGIDTVLLKQISLTTDGRKLLDNLKSKSSRGRIRARIVNLIWIVVTTIITTLVVLKIKGVVKKERVNSL